MPKGTPKDVIEKVNAEVNRALADPKMRARLAELGGKPIAGNAGRLRQGHRRRDGEVGEGRDLVGREGRVTALALLPRASAMKPSSTKHRVRAGARGAVAARPGGRVEAGRDAVGRPPRRSAAVQPPARPVTRAGRSRIRRCARHGEVAAWGDFDRADLTFSVAKTYLALLAGVAQLQGLLPDEDERVSARSRASASTTASTTVPVTWSHLLTQTSEWEGTSFGLPDTVDRWRKVAQDPRPPDGPKGGARRCARRARTGNTTTSASTSSRSRCCTCSAGRCPRCSSSTCSRRSAAAPASPGAATTTPGSISRRRPRAIGSGRIALGRGRLDRRARPGAHRPLLLDGGVAAAAADRERLDRAHVRAVRDRAVLRPPALAEPDRQRFPGFSTRAAFMVGAGGHYVGMDPSSTRSSCCAGSIRRTPAPRCSESAPPVEPLSRGPGALLRLVARDVHDQPRAEVEPRHDRLELDVLGVVRSARRSRSARSPR
jgi:hypothetical protein